MLIKAMFEKAAYGCKLFCAWCAQDLEANRFWESIGFVPLAFRTGAPGSCPRKRGSRKDGAQSSTARIHIFWQKRIREGDADTPYWFPSQTSGGAIREDRLVIPIPPGTHWSDAKPVLLPEIPGVERFVEEDPHPSPLPEGEGERKQARGKRKRKLTVKEKRNSRAGGLWFTPPPPEVVSDDKDGDGGRKPKKKRIKRPRRKYHPEYVAAARELCARYLEEVQAGRFLPEARAEAKYDVSSPRMCRPRELLEGFGSTMQQIDQISMLDAA